jgi:hypothetical protein
MEILITHSKTKRKINGPLNICGSKTDLKSLANQILSQVSENFSHGWVTIHEEQESVVDTPSVNWD